MISRTDADGMSYVELVRDGAYASPTCGRAGYLVDRSLVKSTLIDAPFKQRLPLIISSASVTGSHSCEDACAWRIKVVIFLYQLSLFLQVY